MSDLTCERCGLSGGTFTLGLPAVHDPTLGCIRALGSALAAERAARERVERLAVALYECGGHTRVPTGLTRVRHSSGACMVCDALAAVEACGAESGRTAEAQPVRSNTEEAGISSPAEPEPSPAPAPAPSAESLDVRLADADAQADRDEPPGQPFDFDAVHGTSPEPLAEVVKRVRDCLDNYAEVRRADAERLLRVATAAGDLDDPHRAAVRGTEETV